MSENVTFSTAESYDIKSFTQRMWGLFGTMSNFFSFNSRDTTSETALEVPDEAEETDLKRHATRCALRYRSLKQGQTENGDRLRRMELILLVVGVWLITTSPQLHDLLKTLLGF